MTKFASLTLFAIVLFVAWTIFGALLGAVHMGNVSTMQHVAALLSNAR